MTEKDNIPAKAVKGKKAKNDITILNGLLDSGELTLFKDQDEKTYAEIVKSDGSIFFCDIHSDMFSGWLMDAYTNSNGTFANLSKMKAAVQFISNKAKNIGELVKVAMKFAEENGIHYIDMANDAGEVIQITPDGWEIVDAASLSLKFLRHKTMRPLTTVSPEEGDPKRILKYLNMSDMDKMFYQAGLCLTAFQNIERPIICFKGREGSAKTTAARLFRSVFDASDPLESNCNMTSRELSIAFYNNAVPVFDNVSGIKKGASDMFCQLITGGAYSTRKLYTDAGQYVLSFKRMALLTALDIPSTAPDFLDRCIIIEMDRVTKPVGITELMGQFNDDLPYILAGCLDTIVEAKRLYPDIRIERLPRLADYGKWGAAVAMALGYDPEMYVNTLIERISTYKLKAVKMQKPLLNGIVDYIRDNGDFSGLTSALLEELKPYKQENAKGWPNTAIGLGKKLGNLENDLLELGLTVDKKRNNKGSHVDIRKLAYSSANDVADEVELGQGPTEIADDSGLTAENKIETVDTTADNRKTITMQDAPNSVADDETVEEVYTSVFSNQDDETEEDVYTSVFQNQDDRHHKGSRNMLTSEGDEESAVNMENSAEPQIIHAEKDGIKSKKYETLGQQIQCKLAEQKKEETESSESNLDSADQQSIMDVVHLNENENIETTPDMIRCCNCADLGGYDVDKLICEDTDEIIEEYEIYHLKNCDKFRLKSMGDIITKHESDIKDEDDNTEVDLIGIL